MDRYRAMLSVREPQCVGSYTHIEPIVVASEPIEQKVPVYLFSAIVSGLPYSLDFTWSLPGV
jgi:hypothetical protein